MIEMSNNKKGCLITKVFIVMTILMDLERSLIFIKESIKDNLKQVKSKEEDLNPTLMVIAIMVILKTIFPMERVFLPVLTNSSMKEIFFKDSDMVKEK